MVTFLGRHASDSTKFGPFISSVFGLGKKSAIKICLFLGVSYVTPFSSIEPEKLVFSQSYFSSKFVLESGLKRFISDNIQKKIKIINYSGLRLKQGLPSRGQRTKSNAQTSKRFRKFLTKL